MENNQSFPPSYGEQPSEEDPLLETCELIETARSAIFLAMEHFNHHQEGLIESEKAAELILRQRKVFRTQIHYAADNICNNPQLQKRYSPEVKHLVSELKDQIDSYPATQDDMQAYWFGSEERKNSALSDLGQCLGRFQLLSARLAQAS